MDRGFYSPEPPQPEPLRVNRPALDVAQDVPPALSRERETVNLRGYRYQVSPQEMAALREIGRFRTIAVDDLGRFHYRGEKDTLRHDLDSLAAQGLLREKTIWTDAQGSKLRLVILTETGRQLVSARAGKSDGQAYYSGFVKAREVAHDAAIYWMYQAEARRIEQTGGRVRRVVVDYELKQKVYRPLAQIRPHVSKAEYAKEQAKVAAQNGLKVTGGKILLPDLRIEYETKDGARASVDLELATHHYRGASLRGKAEAGFKLYAPADSAGRMAAHDPELMANILSF